MHENVLSSTMHNRQTVEITQMFINTHNKILSSNNNEQSTTSQNDVDGSHKHNIQQKYTQVTLKQHTKTGKTDLCC